MPCDFDKWPNGVDATMMINAALYCKTLLQVIRVNGNLYAIAKLINTRGLYICRVSTHLLLAVGNKSASIVHID